MCINTCGRLCRPVAVLIVAVLLWLPGTAAAVPDDFLNAVLTQYDRLGDRLGNRDYVGLLNYRQPSWQPRFYIIDPRRREVVAAYRVAHGKGSDSEHDGFAGQFSDRQGSHMSSVGFFKTLETYTSKEPGHGLSMRLRGLSASNRSSYRRAIVIHANHYMEQSFIDRYGIPGRSHGCMVFSNADRDEVIDRLGGGALIYAAY